METFHIPINVLNFNAKDKILYLVIYDGVKYRSYFISKIRVNHVQDVRPSLNHVLAMCPTCRPRVTRRLHYRAHYKRFVNILFRNKSLYYRSDVGLRRGAMVQMMGRGRKEVSSHIIRPRAPPPRTDFCLGIWLHVKSRMHITRIIYIESETLIRYITSTCNSFRLPTPAEKLIARVPIL